MRRFVCVDEFAEGTAFRRGNGDERQLEALRVLGCGVVFLDVEVTTVGAECHVCARL